VVMQCWGVRGKDHEYGRLMFLLGYTLMVLGRLVEHTHTRHTEHEAAVNSRGLPRGECQLSAWLWGAYRLSVSRAQTESDTADTRKEHFNTQRYLTFLRGC
jgi:hypothetical protein